MRLLGRLAEPVTDLAWSADGCLIASSSAGASLPEGPVISVWNVVDGQLGHVIDESAASAPERNWRPRLTPEGGLVNVHPGLSYLAFSPNGDLFASHFGQLIRLDLASARREGIGIGGGPLQITRDGCFLLCGASALWDTSVWKLLPGPLEGKWDGDYIGVESAALAVDGSWYVWCSATPDEKYEPCEIRLGLSDPLTGATLELVGCERRSFIPSRLALDTASDRVSRN